MPHIQFFSDIDYIIFLFFYFLWSSSLADYLRTNIYVRKHLVEYTLGKRRFL